MKRLFHLISATPTHRFAARFRFRRYWLLMAIALAPLVAAADLVLQQQTEYRAGYYWEKELTTIRIKGDQMRGDTVTSMTGATNNGVVVSLPGTTSNSVTSVILDLRTGDSIVLMELYGQKWAVKTSVPRADSKGNSLAKTRLPAPQASGTATAVGGYQTELYNWTNRYGARMKLWVAKDFPDYKEITRQLEKLYNLHATADMPDLTVLPGMVIKSETDAGGTNVIKRITATLISAKEEPVDASAFAIPGDYRLTNPPP